MIAASLALAVALAAPRPSAGGELTIVSWPSLPSPVPAEAATGAELGLAAAIGEPLYRATADGLVAVLAAGLPEFDGSRVRIPLRSGVRRHDGRVLDAEAAAAALLRLGRPGSPAAHVLLPVVGAAVAAEGPGAPAIAASADGRALELRLVGPYPPLARLLAIPQAALMGGPDDTVGTGPFALIERRPEALRLGPHLAHRDGRPFLDTVLWRASATPFAARARLRRGRASVLCGVPDLGDEDRRRTLRTPIDDRAPQSLVVLSVGRRAPALRSPEILSALDRALRRPRLASRYLSGDARPAHSLLGGAEAERAPPPATAPVASHAAVLWVAADRAPGLRFAERVQLDLLRAGVRARIERVAPEAIAEARVRGDHELLLDLLPLPAAPVGDAVDQLHRLLAIASRLGAPSEAVSAEALVAFAADDEAGRLRRLAALEAGLRARAHVVPIAVRAEPVWIGEELQGATIGPDGALHLEDAHLGWGAGE